MDVARTHKYDWKCRFLPWDGCLLGTSSLAVSYFNYKSMKTRETFIAKNKLKLTCVESLSLKVLGNLLNFITWKEKDHITQEGNAKIQPRYAFQCFPSGVKIRI